MARTRFTFITFVPLVVAALLAAQPALAQSPQSDTSSPEAPEATLEGRAVLDADTFAPGPPSGSELGEEQINGRTPPFEGQPVQGFSAVLDAGGADAGDGAYWAMPDNGFGEKGNSSDFLLRLYRIRPDFETGQTPGGSGEIEVEGFVSLHDPDHRIPFEVENDDTRERLLTGADFDPESVRRDGRGDLWFGEEFGPFLLHTDASGRVLEAPIPLPGVKAPENPTLAEGEEATLPTSKGFEGMAISEDRRFLYPMLEGALEDDPDQRRRFIYTFDLGSGEYTGERRQYRTESPEYSIGDLTTLDGDRLLVIERDNEEGEEAAFKKIYEVDLGLTDDSGFLEKREIVDLLAVRDPDLISEPGREGDIGVGDPFAFPFQTIESVLPLDGGRLLVLNDNNYPLSAGRNPDRPDDNEAIVVRLDADAVQIPETGGVTFGNVGLTALLLSGVGLLGSGALVGVSLLVRRSRR